MTVMNDANYQDALHVNKVKWSVCNMNVFNNYLGGNKGSYDIYKELIALKKYNIVTPSLFSSSTLAIMIVSSRPSEPNCGFRDLRRRLTFQSRGHGDSGGSQGSTHTKTKLVVWSGRSRE